MSPQVAVGVLDIVFQDPVLLQQSTGEMGEAIRIAFDTVTEPVNFAFIVLATVLGLIMGVLPGVGGPVALALLIPITFPLDENVAIMILAANLGGTAFGGSITAILFNTPGDAPNAATLLDGYPMARDGRAGEALAASATASAAGALVGVALLLASIPILRSLAIAFHSVDIFWLAVLGLATIAVATRGSILSDLIAGAFGLLIAFHGYNAVTGTARFTWGTNYLLDGIPLLPLIIGLFAVSEMINLASKGTTIARGEEVGGGILKGVMSVFKNWTLFARSSLIGWAIGIIPGAGGTVANFIAYIQAQQTSDDPDSFGKGNVKGVIASESSNDAKDGGSMIPTLGLGIPGSASTAVLLGAFIINGVTPGPLLFQENLQIVYIVVFALVISNVFTSLIGLVFVKHLAKLTSISISTVAPLILIVALLGSFVVRSQFLDVIVAVLFGILGFAMIKFDLSRVPIVIAVVLGPLAESNFHRALQVSRGDFAIFVQRPTSIILILGVLLIVIVPFYRTLKEEGIPSIRRSS